MLPLDVIRLMLLLTVIAYAAIQDHKTGLVTNKTWIYAPFGFALTLTSLMLNPELALMTFLSITCTIGITLTLFYIGAWGGADTKAFLTIALAAPLTPFQTINYAFMYPLNILLLSAIIAFIAAQIKHTKTVRFLPYTLAAMPICLMF